MSDTASGRRVPRPILAKLFAGAVIGSGCMVLVLWGPRGLDNPALFAALFAASVLASSLRLRLPINAASSNFSVSYSLDFAALLLLGAAPTMLIAGTSAWLQSALGHDRQRSLVRSAFSAATLVLTVQAAGATFVYFGGESTLLDNVVALPVLASALVYYLVNTCLVAVAVGLAGGTRPWDVWLSNFLWTAPNYFVGAGAAVVGVVLSLTGRWWLLPLAAAPVYLTFRSYRMYADRLIDEQRHRDEVLRLHLETTAALEAARRSEQRYALAADGANDGLWDWDIQANTLYCSDRWTLMIGLPTGTTVSTVEEWLAHVEEADRAGLAQALEAHRHSDRSLFEHEYRMQHVDGSSRWVLCRGIAVRDEAGRAIRMAGSQTDISEQRAIRETLALAAQHDPLTNLPNRTLFRELVQRAIAQGRRSHSRYAVLFIDLDGFKQINDTHGHVAGDRFLAAIATRLQSELRPGDSLARLGGDEFGVLAENLAGPVDFQAIADRLLRALTRPFQVDTHELHASASIGIVVGTPQYQSVDALLRDADIAMYRAKAAGRGRYEIFDPAMHASALKRLALHSELRRALERNEFVVFYQPIVELPSSRISGLEALVRWVRADGHVMLPAEFIPSLEDTGLIVPVTYHVLQEACHQVAAWQQMFERPLDLSVNISPRLFTRPEFIDAVQTALTDSGLLPASLRVEISEAVLINHSEVIDYHFARLRELRVAVHLDNFGSGYASLSYLQRYPVDALKLDKSFVARMGTGANDNVGNAIVKLARDLGMGLIAEGVETPAHAEQLRALQCPHAQGYLFSGPLTAGELVALLVRDGDAALPDQAATVSAAAPSAPHGRGPSRE